MRGIYPEFCVSVLGTALYRAIYRDRMKYAKQYRDDFSAFVSDAFSKQWNKVYDRERARFYARKQKPENRTEEWENFRW